MISYTHNKDLTHEDIISLDVPLFIRLLEFAREDSPDDETLHRITENAIDLSQDGQILSMDDYNNIVDVKDNIDVSNLHSVDENLKYKLMLRAGLIK